MLGSLPSAGLHIFTSIIVIVPELPFRLPSSTHWPPHSFQDALWNANLPVLKPSLVFCWLPEWRWTSSAQLIRSFTSWFLSDTTSFFFWPTFRTATSATLYSCGSLSVSCWVLAWLHSHYLCLDAALFLSDRPVPVHLHTGLLACSTVLPLWAAIPIFLSIAVIGRKVSEGSCHVSPDFILPVENRTWPIMGVDKQLFIGR
jgi:hypothetical protein